MIQCFNPSCRSISTPPAGRCKVCETPLLYRFLLAVGDAQLEVRPGALVAGRFLVWGDRLWLDTRPDTPAPTLEQIPAPLLPYLKLFHLAQHVPRPYAYLTTEETGLGEMVLLLDMAPVGTRLTFQDGGPGRIEAALLPSLPSAWARGSALQQLNWLRQVAYLWPALAEHQVARTLLDLDDLRVDGALLRLTTLVADGSAPTLADLGQRWAGLAAIAQPSVMPYLDWLSQALAKGQLTSATELVAELQGAIQTLAQGLRVTVEWVADTDQGPARDRNEDACYPQHELRQQQLTGSALGTAAPPLLLVCDGIGGHEQGNVASQTAIKLIQQELEPLTQQPHLTPEAIAQHLQRALILANDAISARNNDEQRSSRARMGTTVVAALVHFPYVSIAHIGDSRAYRVSARTCYQITVDDDVASREAQMGYALYSEAVQLPSGGTLVQALGISASGYLHPSVQHLLLDDEAVLLLCSDGLSDYDRVEAIAPHLVAPLVTTAGSLEATVAELIKQANRLNGHDNVTVGLMRLQPQPAALPILPADSLKQANSATHFIPLTAAPTRIVAPSAQPELASPSPRSKFAWLPFLGGITVVLTVLGVAALGFVGRQPEGGPAPMALQPLSAQWPTGLGGQPLLGAALAATVDLPVGSFLQVTGAVNGDRLTLLGQPKLGLAAPGPESSALAVALATGSILKVVSRQTTADAIAWVRLQVCSIPSGRSLAQRPQETDRSPLTQSAAPDLNQRLAAPGDEGWAQTRQLYGAATFLELVTPAQADRCLP